MEVDGEGGELCNGDVDSDCEVKAVCQVLPPGNTVMRKVTVMTAGDEG